MTIIDPGPPRLETLAGGFATVQVPNGWETVRDSYPGVELVVVEPEQEGHFRASLVITVTDVSMSFAEWQQGTDVYLAKELRDYLLLDLERLPVAGHPGGRRLATYATDENQSVTLEQWMTLVDGRGVSVAATTATLRYAMHAHLVAQVVGSLRVPPGATDATDATDATREARS